MYGFRCMEKNCECGPEERRGREAAVMPYDKRIRETLLKIETCRDDAQATGLALELGQLLHQQVEQIRRTVLKLKKVRRSTTVWAVSLKRSDMGIASEQVEQQEVSQGRSPLAAATVNPRSLPE